MGYLHLSPSKICGTGLNNGKQWLIMHTVCYSQLTMEWTLYQLVCHLSLKLTGQGWSSKCCQGLGSNALAVAASVLRLSWRCWLLQQHIPRMCFFSVLRLGKMEGRTDVMFQNCGVQYRSSGGITLHARDIARHGMMRFMHVHAMSCHNHPNKHKCRFWYTVAWMSIWCFCA